MCMLDPGKACFVQNHFQRKSHNLGLTDKKESFILMQNATETTKENNRAIENRAPKTKGHMLCTEGVQEV